MKPEYQFTKTEPTAHLLRLRASITEMTRHPLNNAIARINLCLRLRDVPQDIAEEWPHMDPALQNDGHVINVPTSPIILLAEKLTVYGDEVEILLSNPAVHGFLSGGLHAKLLGDVARYLDEPGNPFSGDKEIYISLITGCRTPEDIAEIREALRRHSAEIQARDESGEAS